MKGLFYRPFYKGFLYASCKACLKGNYMENDDREAGYSTRGLFEGVPNLFKAILKRFLSFVKAVLNDSYPVLRPALRDSYPFVRLF